MYRKVRQTTVLGIVLAVVFAFNAYGRQSGQDSLGFRGEKKRPEVENFIKELGLTPEQQDKIKAERDKSLKEQRALREDISSKREELAKELERTDVDKAKISSLVSDLKQLEGRAIEQRVGRILSMREYLTPEQFKKFQDKIKEYKNRRKERMKSFKKRFGDKVKGYGRDKTE